MRIILINLFLLSSLSAFAMEREENDTVIPDAAYLIYDGAEHAVPTGAIPGRAEFATFYSATGDTLRTVSREECDLFEVGKRLDPHAPKPQPATYAIKYWPAFQIGFGLTKGAPGYFIVFRDRHGNHVKSYRYDQNARTITTACSRDGNTVISLDRFADLESLDTSVVHEAYSDEIRDHNEGTPWSCSVQ